MQQRATPRGTLAAPWGSGLTDTRPAPALSADAQEIVESRFVWIFGSPRTGSTWLLRMLLWPWRLAANPTGLRPPVSVRRGGPPIVPVNESHLPLHLTPQKVPR